MILKEYEEKKIAVADGSSLGLLSPQGAVLASFSHFSGIIAIGRYASSSGMVVVHNQQNRVMVNLIPDHVVLVILRDV